MTITNVHKDIDSLTMTITAEFPASTDRVWQVWADPRQLERWWGPPTYPAKVDEHDLKPGGRVTYSMTGPEGDTHRGYWRVLAVEAPHRLEVEDGFADASGTPNDKMPTTKFTVEISEKPGGGTRMDVHSIFPSREAMEQLIEMGMEEGMKEAASQLDAILAE